MLRLAFWTVSGKLPGLRVIFTEPFRSPYTVKNLRALYENGWFEGIIDYYNELQKYLVHFADGSEDHIGEDDIDMVEVVRF